MEITNFELIVKALSVLAPRRIGDYIIGDVSSALLTEDDSVFLGVCVDVISGIGFCAEYAAIAAMVTAGKHRINNSLLSGKMKITKSIFLPLAVVTESSSTRSTPRI